MYRFLERMTWYVLVVSHQARKMPMQRKECALLRKDLVTGCALLKILPAGMYHRTYQSLSSYWNKPYLSELFRRWWDLPTKDLRLHNLATELSCMAMPFCCDITTETCISPACPQVHPKINLHLMSACKKQLKESHVGGQFIRLPNRDRRARRSELGMTSSWSASLQRDIYT